MIAILGPTATGKSALAMNIAERVEAEILSVDSMQVYRDMDIGTAKPEPAQRERVTHHMVDVAEPEDAYTVAEFRRQARSALAGSAAPLLLVVGGSGLHFRAVVDPMTFRPVDSAVRANLEREAPDQLVGELLRADPNTPEHVDLNNPRRVRRAVEAWRVGGVTPSELAASPQRRAYGEYRPELRFTGIGIDRADLADGVDARLDRMMAAGLLDEVARLAPRLGRTARQAVGYRQLLPVVTDGGDLADATDAVRRATMTLVKRQRTFFRRDPRLRWFDAGDPDLAGRVMAEAGL